MTQDTTSQTAAERVAIERWEGEGGKALPGQRRETLSSERVENVVLGGGEAGKYIAWELAKHGGEPEMSKPETIVRGAVFDLAAIDAELRREDAYGRDGHTARTLVREGDIRVVLIVMRAGARIAEHRANETASIHALSGHVRLRLPDRDAELLAGRLLVLERGLPHDVEAISESAFLLTLGWKG
jgi:quercetin dioxygenase-like cupin family protein